MSLGFTLGDKNSVPKQISTSTVISKDTKVTDLSGVIIVTETSTKKKRDKTNHAIWLKSSLFVSVTLAIFLFIFN